MPYIATIPVVFPYARGDVFDALTNLDLYPLWNSGLLSVSRGGRLELGTHYRVESMVPGRVNVSEIEVNRFERPKLFELVSRTGLVWYRATFELRELAAGSTEVICVLRFEFKNFVLDLARPVIEAMAAARLKGDLETLKVVMANR